MWRGILVFVVTYVLVATRRLRFVEMDRASGALIGAVLAVALGAITTDEASRAVDHTTIVLLLAVMGMGAFLSVDGFLDRAGEWLLRRARTPARLVGFVVWGAGLLSAVVTNDAVCVLAAPLVVGWIAKHRLPRLPLLLALATGANTGSVATLVGNPQNMLCGSLGQLGFARFLLHMAPVAVVGLALNHAVLLALFRSDLGGELPAEALAASPRPLFTRKSVLTIGVLVATVVVYTCGAPLAFTALGGFALLLLVQREPPARIWERIDWSVLLFFSGLFIAVDAFARSGAAAWAFAHVPLATGGSRVGMALRASTIFLVGSNVVTNVPFILIVRSEMGKLGDPVLAWELLAMASTFAGNLTLLGSVANVIVAEKARDVGGLRFGEYLRVGLPVAILTTLVGALLLVAIRF